MLEAAIETAADIMSRDVAVVHPDTSMRSLLRLMAERRISGVPVVDGEGRIVGMVSEGDVIRWHDGLDQKQEHWLDQLGEGLDVPPAFVGWMQARHESVHAVMRPGEPITVTEDTPVREIEALMTTRDIKRVPVLRDGRIVGIVARSDLVRLLARLLAARAEAATA
jgi:CBS domain-containing protein